jgi:hypothetical protein
MVFTQFPADRQISVATTINLSLLLNLILTLTCMVLVYLLRKKSIINPLQKQQPAFSNLEEQIILKLNDSPSDERTVADINLIIGVDGKSIDQQNKKRSRLIRSINNKTEKITGKTSPLIVSARTDDDRRMHIYLIEKKIFTQIKPYLPSYQDNELN